MENAPTILREPPHAPTILLEPPPDFPPSPSSFDLSPLEFILALLAVITIPALVYAFFFAVKCPPWPFRRRDRSFSRRSSGESDGAENGVVSKANEGTEMASGLKYRKDAHVKDVGIECPVCLCAFADGEVVRQLSACKHSFHASCIDMWLKSHSNCPICRAPVPAKPPNNNNAAPPRGGDDDLHQGLPDSASLVW